MAAPETTPPRIELLRAQHDRTGFICGKESLDQYFQRQVTQDARRHLASPFVMIMPGGAIGGFYTLSSTALRLGDLPEDVARRLPRYPLVPATLIGRLAIDRRYHGQGWGSFLFLDALYRCSRSEVASFAVIVDALDDEARAFYVHHSFLPLPDSPYRLFRRMSDIEALLMIGKDSFETTAAQVTALLQLGFGPDERVTIIIEAVEGVATTRQKSQVCVVVAGHAGGDRGGAIEQPNLAERIRRRFAPFGGVDLELPPREVVDEPSSFDP